MFGFRDCQDIPLRQGFKSRLSSRLWVTETSVANTVASLICRTLVTDLYLEPLQLLAISARKNMDRHTSVSLGTPAPYMDKLVPTVSGPNASASSAMLVDLVRGQKPLASRSNMTWPIDIQCLGAVA